MKYGLIGKTLSHSYSKVIHHFLGNREYELVEIPPDAVEHFLRAASFRGINVTIPYKETVMPWCVPDDAAKKIGSVNTIVNKNGTLYGYNTDYFGFSFMARNANISLEGKKVIILGSGGTSKTAACVAQDSRAGEIVIVSRTGKDNYGNISRHADGDVLINTTPVGMFPDNGHSPISLQCFTNLCAVIDVIYNPLRTRLLLQARELGIDTANGLSMLAAQAVYAHNLFFDIKPNGHDDTMKIAHILSETEKRFSNIVLIGMPGCGKTTIGTELAKLLDRDFADTDRMIEESTGRRVPDIIREDGEPVFRELERTVIAQASAQTNRVIATGGGSVLAKENREALLQNGIIVFLDRELGSLATGGRPLSVDLHALYRQRLPIYQNLCRYTVKVGDDLQDNVRRIVEVLNDGSPVI